MTKKLFLTCTLPYVGKLHCGHLWELTLTEAISKYFKNKLGEENVLTNTGIDEMGLKAWEKAKDLNIPIEEYLENNAKEFKEFCSLFEIKYDSLYRTSSKDHHEKVKKLWNIWLSNDDIYKKSYSAL